MSWLTNALTPGSAYDARRYRASANDMLGMAGGAAQQQMPNVYSLLGGLTQTGNTPGTQAGLLGATAGAQRDLGLANAATVGAARRAGLGNSSWLANGLGANAGAFGNAMAGARVGNVQAMDQNRLQAAQLLASLLNPTALANQYSGMADAANQETMGLLSALTGLAGLVPQLQARPAPLPALPASPTAGGYGPQRVYPY